MLYLNAAASDMLVLKLCSTIMNYNFKSSQIMSSKFYNISCQKLQAFYFSTLNLKIICCIFSFFRLFEEHSELLRLFEKFSSLRTKEEQQESLELAEHASMVMNTLHNAISSLDNPDAFFQFLEQVGGSHNRIPGFNKDFFWVSQP